MAQSWFIAKFVTKPVLRMMEEAPKVFNGSMNRAIKKAGGQFNRKFASERLSGGTGIKIHRTIAGRKRLKGQAARQIFTPKKMLAAGFTGELLHPEKLDGKGMRIGTSSPVMHGHENPGIRRPVKKRMLRVRVTTPRARSRLAASAKDPRIRKRRLPFFILVPRVRATKRLRFVDTWPQFRPTAIGILLHDGVEDGVRRLERTRFSAGLRRAA